MDEFMSFEAIMAGFIPIFKELLKKKGINDAKMPYQTDLKKRRNKVYLDLPSYAWNVNYGRGKGSFPPVDAIYKWLIDKGLRPKAGDTYQSMAWAIAVNIKQEGVKGRPFIKALEMAFRKYANARFWEKQLNIFDNI